MSRLEKVQKELQHQISLIVQQELKDPRIGFVTITGVEITPDLKTAKVYFTRLGPKESFEDTVNGLNSSAGFIRKLIGERIRMKFTPQINFIYDDLLKRQDRIDEIIDKIHKEEEKNG